MKYLPVFLLFLSGWTFGQESPESRVSDYLNSIRTNRALLRAFFQQMPKGGDLHHHYSGSVYAESYFEYVVNKDFWVHTVTLELFDRLSPEQEKTPEIQRFSSLKAEGKLDELRYRLLKLWSIKDYNGLDLASDRHFFQTFDKFTKAKEDYPAGLRELKKRALAEHLHYIETMLRPVRHGLKLETLNDYAPKLQLLNDQKSKEGLFTLLDEIHQKAGGLGLAQGVKIHNQWLENLHQQTVADDSLFRMRYQNYISRTQENLVEVFVSLIASFLSAEQSNLIVGVNIVAPEDNPVSMRNYWIHMQMFAWCAQKFPSVKYTMHAGELSLGLVKPEELTWHIHAAVWDAGADRIGHGVDLAYEKNPYELLKQMQVAKIAVEINLSSNEFILDVKNDLHPISLYHRAGVPIVISTDDAGILRTDLTEQFVLLANRYPEISYYQIKEFVYNSIRFSFIEEESIKNQMLNSLRREFVEFENTISRFATK